MNRVTTQLWGRLAVAMLMWGIVTIGLFMAGGIQSSGGVLFTLFGWISVFGVVIGLVGILWGVGKHRFPGAFMMAEVVLGMTAYIFTAAFLGLCIYAAIHAVPTYLVIVAQVVQPLSEAQIQVLGWSIVLTALFCVAVYYASQVLLHFWERFPRFAAGFWGLYFIGLAEYLVRTRAEVSGAVFCVVFGVLLMLIASARFRRYEERVKAAFSQLLPVPSLSAKKS